MRVSLLIALLFTSSLAIFESGDITIDAKMTAADEIEFTCLCNTADAVSLGIGTSMTDTDMWFVKSDGTSKDVWSTSHATPGDDTTNNVLTPSTSLVGGRRQYKMSRKLNTGDSQDTVLKTGVAQTMMWSLHSDDQFTDHGSRFGRFTLQIDGTVVTLGAKKKSFDSYEIHGLGCYVAWGLLSFLLIITGRYFKNFHRIRIVLHIIIGILVVVFSMIFTSYADKGEDDSPKAVSNKLAHEGTAGMTNGLGLIVSIIGGVYLGIFLILTLIK